MALENNDSNMVMPVAPMYGGGYGNGGFGGGFGGDGWWVLLLLLAFSGGGWGNGFGGMGGMGGMMGFGIDFPWLLNGQQDINNNVSDGFRDAQLHDSITSVGDRLASLSTQLCDCCGQTQMSIANSTAALQNSLCNGFNGVNTSISGAQNAISNQLYNNEIASLNRSFAEQTANTQGFTSVNSGIADLRYTEATEACATRTAAATNTRDIIDSQTRGTQAILDKLCALELDSAKREAADLRQQLNMAQLAASQTAQNAFIAQGFANEVDQLYNRLNTCPVPSTPVFGRTPIFTCGSNTGCGCGGNGFVN